jgi:hypothetical protein
VGRIRLALQEGGLETLLHVDTNGRAAQEEAWTKRKRSLRRLASARTRDSESALEAAVYLSGMESPPLERGAPHW